MITDVAEHRRFPVFSQWASRAVLLMAAVAVTAMIAACPHSNSGKSRIPQLRQWSTNRTATGKYHTVKPGDTLYRVSNTYGVNLQELAEVNNLAPPFVIRVGARLFIPGATEVKRVHESTGDAADMAAVEDFAGLLAWPVDGPIVSHFGVKDASHNNGIRISAPAGTPVKAAAEGVVGHVGNIPGYGNVMVLEHADRLHTVYAHLQDTRGKKGWRVATGETIGLVGSSGRVDAPSLYFEVRSRSRPRNPLFFLTRKNTTK